MTTQHNWVEQELDGKVNGQEVTTKYFVCSNCWVIKAIRAKGNIDYIFDNNSLTGRLLKSEPPCLTVIDGGKED